MSTGFFYVTDISGQVPSQDKEVTDAGVEAYRKNCKVRAERDRDPEKKKGNERNFVKALHLVHNSLK